MSLKHFFLISIFIFFIFCEQEKKAEPTLLFESTDLLQEIEFTFEIKVPLQCKGVNLILLPKFKKIENINLRDASEPNIENALSFGFDTENLAPKRLEERNLWFGKGDNIYQKPQREISIHYNKIEYANRLSTVEFRDHIRNPASLKLNIKFIEGGAVINLSIKNIYSRQVVYRDYFLPHLKPYLFDIFFSHEKFIKNFKLTKKFLATKKSSEDFFVIQGFNKKFIRWENGVTNKKREVIQFPKTNISRLHKIIFELEIHPESKEKWDGWDRLCSFFIEDEKGKKFEIARFITPYFVAGKWFVDVTDYYPLLKNKKFISTNLQNWFKVKGFLLSTKFYFYLGEQEKKLPQKVIYLGDRELKIGNPKIPIARLTNQKIIIKENFSKVKLRILITGHGYMEFVPINYFIGVGDSIHQKKLWNEECYLNPIRPQSGTWKFSRSGWCPGTTVEPIEIDITDEIKNNSVKISHVIEKYIHMSKDKKYNGLHFISRAIIIY